MIQLGPMNTDFHGGIAGIMLVNLDKVWMRQGLVILVKPLLAGMITPTSYTHANKIGVNPLWLAPASNPVIPPYRKSFQGNFSVAG